MEIILKTENLTKQYGQKVVLDKVCMSINKGDIYGFIGKNGAGKTTFMRCVLGMTKSVNGKIEHINNYNVGSLIETPGVYGNCTAYENMKRFAILSGCDDKDIHELLCLVGLSEVGKKKVKKFSLGMKQRLGIAIALLGNPDFLVLDEPINGLDPTGIKEVRELILKLNKEKNITFLISSHLLDELSNIATKYGIINKGRLIEEITSDELDKKCCQNLYITVYNPRRAYDVLKDIIGEDKIEVNDNSIVVYSHFDDGAKINQILSKNDLYVSRIEQDSQNLEKYFIERIGE